MGFLCSTGLGTIPAMPRLWVLLLCLGVLGLIVFFLRTRLRRTAVSRGSSGPGDENRRVGVQSFSTVPLFDQPAAPGVDSVAPDTVRLQWRSDPNLRDRFHPEFPDDLQVLFYDYELLPRNPAREMMWVHLTGLVTAGVYEGTLLNQPGQLKCVQQGDKVMIRLAPGGTYPLYLSAQAARDRRDWGMRCQKCGFDMLPCPPAVLIDKQFENRPDPGSMEVFTTRCWVCNETMFVWRWDMGNEELRSQLPPKPRDVLRSPLYQEAPGAGPS